MTRDCNLRCRYCFVHGGEIKHRIARRIVGTAIEHVITPRTKKLRLTFSGGEPTTHTKALKWALEKAEDIGINTNYKILTNGVMSDDLLLFLIDKGLRVQRLSRWFSFHSK